MIQIYKIVCNTKYHLPSNKHKMPVTTRKQSKEQKEQQFQKRQNQNQNQVKKNHANIDFVNASNEWRKNKIKHENGYFTYIGNHE